MTRSCCPAATRRETTSATAPSSSADITAISDGTRWRAWLNAVIAAPRMHSAETSGIQRGPDVKVDLGVQEAGKGFVRKGIGADNTEHRHTSA